MTRVRSLSECNAAGRSSALPKKRGDCSTALKFESSESVHGSSFCRRVSREFPMPPRGSATADENHVAQTALLAVCGLSSPRCPKAADLPEMQEVATRSCFLRSHQVCHSRERTSPRRIVSRESRGWSADCRPGSPPAWIPARASLGRNDRHRSVLPRLTNGSHSGNLGRARDLEK